MEDVIVLSSSDEDDRITSMGLTQKIETNSSFAAAIDCDDVDDFDFGTNVTYNRISPEPEVLSSSPNDKVHHLSSYRGAQQKRRLVHDLSDSDDANDEFKLNNPRKSNESSDDELPDLNINFGLSSSVPKKIIEFESSSGLPISSYTSSESKPSKQQEREEKRMQKQLEISEKVKQRQALKEEREKKKQEAVRAKALKQATAEVERSKKPGECLKWVTSVLDTGLLTADYSGELLTALRASEVDYKVEECVIPCSVSWERRLQNVQVAEDMAVQKTTTIQNEPFVLIVWMWNKLVQDVNDNTLDNTIAEILSLLPDQKLTIVIFGLEDYFRFQKTQKNRNFRSQVQGTGPQKRKPKEGTFEAAPAVSRGDVEFALAELQVKWNISHRCINSKTDLANIVCQFTKAIAEAPFKREKHQKNAERLDWYALADSKDCVVVDKDGNGSLQLWQRQLCQFPLASRESSEAIVSLYPSPLALLQAYEECSNEDEAQSLLEDIPVRRGPGPLATSRRIGPQLSKKIHTFFTTFDECCLIAPD